MDTWGRFERSCRILSHPIRRKILHLLSEGARSFRELSDICGMNHGKLGHHLRGMAGILERDPGRNLYGLTEEGRMLYEWFLRASMDYMKSVLDLEIGPELNPVKYAGKLSPGDHSVIIYESEPIRRAVALSFLEAGLREGSALIYLAAEGRVGRAAEEISSELGMGAGKGLEIMGAEEWYMGLGEASPDLIMENWRRLAKRKLGEGYVGVRVVTEAHGLIKKLDFLAIEERIGKRLPGTFCSLCQYDASKLEPEAIIALLRNHGHALFERVALKLA
ncbi:MAG: MEDS domain-containing protein [Candidatus Bathyarchaeia archaeon]